MGTRERADAIGYGRAVANALTAVGIENSGATPAGEPGKLKRALSISLLELYWHIPDFGNSVRMSLEWDEEHGWALLDVNEPGAVRGHAYTYHDLDLGVLPEPAKVARLVDSVLAGEERLSGGCRRRYRMAIKHNLDFEAALAAYPARLPGDSGAPQ
ncbi:hypothetical protein HD597_004607 [Nonomuraea thailandensis]|uniref:DUF6292 domain-containing protein n=1 Tax=Nonomuraea thailandensis TaxID=1188745 RepID=A0A9X2GFF3_9ACTN|nr:DUF6292 family protein [Nonomuraea thailandensis]MCP2357587.1 hypothetical protein [Nonomuraea thailandensis]